jgi:DNA-directed RNA polymerase subunit RPC12/RpoP
MKYICMSCASEMECQGHHCVLDYPKGKWIAGKVTIIYKCKKCKWEFLMEHEVNL